MTLGVDLPARRRAILHDLKQLYLEDAVPWVVGYSGGKDSTAVLQLVWTMLSGLLPEQRHKPVYVITTDTRVESPVVAAWVTSSLEAMRRAAQEQQLPITPHLLRPPVEDSFWVNLIGRGYPAPRYKFRWCTERLKIKPSNRFIRDVVQASGEAILVLGARKAESSKRAAVMTRLEKHRARDYLSPNAALPGSLVCTPIEDWSNDEVWLFLNQSPNPWGANNRDLVSMYARASEDNECPLVVDTSTPSCGNSRFGCWVCTMVERDRSMEAMVRNDDEREWMTPLLEIRNELDLADDRERRDFRRMSGRVQLYRGRPIPGPYLKVWREHWLRRVLTVETDLRRNGPPQARHLTLLAVEEIQEIRRIWLYEKHELDDAAARIYAEVTGLNLPGAERLPPDLPSLDIDLLAEVARADPEVEDLARRVLGTVHAWRARGRRSTPAEDLDELLRARGTLSLDELEQAQDT